MHKKITIIINPGAGKKDSILWSLNNAFHKKDIEWGIKLTHGKGDAFKLARNVLKNRPKYLAVYGGDGTVAEVAKALYKSATSLFIIPGGTNNVIAKELNIPTEVDQALALFTRKEQKIQTIDMGLFQGEPFILRIESGIFAKMVKDTKRKSKRILGQLSYPIQLLPHFREQKIFDFRIRIDDKDEISASGISLIIANVGNVGIENYSLVPKSNVNDGMLDVILFKDKPVESFFVLLKSAITGRKPQGPVKIWKAKKVRVVFEKDQDIISDDQGMKTKIINAEISANSLKVLVP